MNIVRYDASMKVAWNSFIRNSKNGLFFFEREFMDYHSDRFKDHSVVIYDKSVIVAVFPANEQDEVIYSHQGLTFGSLILEKKVRTSEVLAMFDGLKEYYKGVGIRKIVYKTIPYTFSSYPSQEDLYALFRYNAQLIRRDISTVIELKAKIEYSSSKKNQVNKLQRNGFSVVEESDCGTFWTLLTETLTKYHSTKPVHTIEEIQQLKDNFPERIRLFSLYEEQELLSGVLLFDFGNVVHTQYMANSDKGRKKGALSFINYYLINQVFRERSYYSFGISTEDNGRYLNEGLIQQKEEMGGRGIALDCYEFDL